jgi:large subunit ribosomal protein L20
LARIKMGTTTRKRHNKMLEMTKGQRASRHLLYKRAHESMIHSLSYAYAHRRERKGDMRRIWISRINAACRADGTSYSQLIEALTKAGNVLNRKVLADMAIREPESFSQLLKSVQSS